ncbi:single-stranded DNA-binding protein [Streptomyces sp. N2A]|uniref:single-stranded DNA-binding protein n=1 Tax=Streptomyces sp. N2A TaxID=3073936 RepID=UPI0028708724|nr:single-stranded DNA-binding protein [Streptomyces sp. N2A]
MNETMVTLVGNAATAVEHRQTTAGVTVARFRLAATSRRWDKAQERWADGETSFYTVRSWRGLADNVAASVAVGEPLVVQGRLRLREGEQPPEKGGQRWFSAEVDAVAIGHDLSRGTAAFRRVTRVSRMSTTEPEPEPEPEPFQAPRPDPEPTTGARPGPSPQQQKTAGRLGTRPGGRPEGGADREATGAVTKSVTGPVTEAAGEKNTVTEPVTGPVTGPVTVGNSPQKAAVP